MSHLPTGPKRRRVWWRLWRQPFAWFWRLTHHYSQYTAATCAHPCAAGIGYTPCSFTGRRGRTSSPRESCAGSAVAERAARVLSIQPGSASQSFRRQTAACPWPSSTLTPPKPTGTPFTHPLSALIDPLVHTGHHTHDGRSARAGQTLGSACLGQDGQQRLGGGRTVGV